MRAALAALAALAVIAAARPAAADDRITRFVLAGISVSYVRHGDASGGQVGAEASFAITAAAKGEGAMMGGSHRWGGVYVDVLRDFAIDRTRLSIGPELGYELFGVDGGFMYQTDEGRKGVVVRPVLTVGVVTLFYRYGRYIDDDLPDKSFHEFGIIGKLPKKLE